MLFFAFNNIQTQKEHKISIARLSTHLNIKDLNKIKEKLLEMVERNINLHSFYYYFESLNISGDTIVYSYPENLTTLLHNQLTYKILTNMLRVDFSTKYAAFLCEFCLYYKCIGINQVVSLRNLRNYLGLTSAHYNNFKSFENNVLIPALYEIQSNTSLSISIKNETEGGNIIGLKFNIKDSNKQEFLASQDHRMQFILQNIALAKYYKISQNSKDNIKQQCKDWADQNLIKINNDTFKDFLVQMFIAPFDMILIQELLFTKDISVEKDIEIYKNLQLSDLALQT